MPDFADSFSPADYNTEIRLFAADGTPKPLWQENELGKALRLAGREQRIPGVTGYNTFVQRTHNLITNIGHQVIAGRLANLGSFNPATYLAIGTGTTPAAVTDTALETESTGSGLARAAATASLTTVNVANDTMELVYTFTNNTGATVPATEEGIFDAASGGHLLARQVYAVVNIAATDTMQVTHKVTC